MARLKPGHRGNEVAEVVVGVARRPLAVDKLAEHGPRKYVIPVPVAVQRVEAVEAPRPVEQVARPGSSREGRSSHHSGSWEEPWLARVAVAAASPVVAEDSERETAAPPAGTTSSQPTLRLLQFALIRGLASSSRAVETPSSCAMRQHTSPAFTT